MNENMNPGTECRNRNGDNKMVQFSDIVFTFFYFSPHNNCHYINVNILLLRLRKIRLPRKPRTIQIIHSSTIFNNYSVPITELGTKYIVVEKGIHCVET
jgi:hypothetical protein